MQRRAGGGAHPPGARVDSLARDADAPVRSAQPYRDRLLAGMAELCAAAPRARDPKVREALGGVFLRVLAAADPDTRRRFAERIAAQDWVSPALAQRLAGDSAEIAAPVIVASPALDDAALERLARTGGPEQRAALARRPGLPPEAAATLAWSGDPLALTALASAEGTTLSAEVMAKLIDRSRDLAALRAPLVRRPELDAAGARRLGGWVGEALRRELAARFDLPPPRETGRTETDARLVGKLKEAGQLRPGFLLRTLREGKLSLFETALAALGGFDPHDVALAVRSPTSERFALACFAVGLDRSVYPTVLELVRGLAGGAPGDLRGAPALPVLQSLGPARAAEAFRAYGR